MTLDTDPYPQPLKPELQVGEEVVLMTTKGEAIAVGLAQVTSIHNFHKAFPLNPNLEPLHSATCILHPASRILHPAPRTLSPSL